MSSSPVTASSTPMLDSLEFSEDVRALIPETYLREIEFNNTGHSADDPTALVLMSKDDYNGSIYNPSTYFFLLNISKTHRLAIEIIKDVSEIKSTIDKQTKKVDLLSIEAHGEKASIKIAENSELKEEDLDSKIFENLSSGATIFLSSCNTGKEIAQKIAGVSKRIVFAPTQIINPIQLIYSYSDGQPKMLSYDNTEEYVSIFKDGEIPTNPSVTAEELDKYFTSEIDYLEGFAKDGDVKAQFCLGLLYLKNQDIDNARKWFSIAAENKNIDAQFNLGYIDLKDGRIQEAKEVFLKLEFTKRADLLFNLGKCFEIEGDLEKAKFYYLEAIKENFADAQNSMGVILANEEKFKEAKELFEQAAEQGHQDALFNLEIIINKERNNSEVILAQ